MAERDPGRNATGGDGQSPASEGQQQHRSQRASGGGAQSTLAIRDTPRGTDGSSSSSSDDKRRQRREELQWYGDWMAANEAASQNTNTAEDGSLTSDWQFASRNAPAPDVDSSVHAPGQSPQQEVERRARNQPRYRDNAPRHETQHQGGEASGTQSSGMRARDTLVPPTSAPRRSEARSHTVSAGSPHNTPEPSTSPSTRKRGASTSISNDPRREFRPAASAGASGSSPLSRPPLRQPASSEQQHSSFRNLVLPRWQPDEEAVNCFVCGSEFAWYLRRHHCRKCGRVVCANCSSHRVRMPSEFVVHPPGSTRSGSIFPAITSSGEYRPARGSSHSTGMLDDSNSETVRVCNPCVPDPNLSPPPSHQPYTVPAPPPFSYVQRGSSDIPELARGMVFEERPPSSGQHPRSSSQAIPQRGHPPPYQQDRPLGASLGSSPQPRHRNRTSTSPFSGHRHRHTQSAAQAPPRPTTPPPRPAASSAPRPVAPLPPRRSRPQIPEEDECPICHLELPPRGADGDLTAREQHIANCVQINMNTPGSGHRASPSAESRPGRATAPPGSASAGGPSSSSGAHDLPPDNRPPVASRRLTGLGMLVYKATEKDCVAEDGTLQECVICLVEFEVGDEMARMECFCKFHKDCLRTWWNTKGNGECPTHALHD